MFSILTRPVNHFASFTFDTVFTSFFLETEGCHPVTALFIINRFS
jgi:hypothetical protein